MSGDQGRTADPSGPPWNIDVLADLHAGVYPADVAARLRDRIDGDQGATAIMAALDSTVDDLSLLPVPRMPARYALRLDAAIAAESQAHAAGLSPGLTNAQGGRQMAQPGPVRSASRPPGAEAGPARSATSPSPQLTTTPPAGAVPAQFVPRDQLAPQGQLAPQDRLAGPVVPAHDPGRPVDPPSAAHGNVIPLDAARSRRRRWIGGLGVAAAVVVAATVTLTARNHSTGGTASATGGGSIAATSVAAPNALELTPGQFQQAFQQINGASSGPLTNALVAAACYGANGIVGTDVLGVTEVTFHGGRAAAIAVRISATQARIVVVGPGCGVNGATAALDSEIVTR